MKVKCIVHEYFDKEEQEYIKMDDIFETNEVRGKTLIDLGFVEEVKVNKMDKAATNK